MHIKDFDTWNITKKHVDASHTVIQSNRREVWWSSLGINIGAEIDGKNHSFERPVLIVKRINADTVIALPLTTKGTADIHHVIVEHDGKTSFAKLSQIRTISTKRLRRKLYTLSKLSFSVVLQRLNQYLAS